MTVTIDYKGTTYNLAANLRVAYMIQGQHDHTPYQQVLKDMFEMPVEQQIDIIYAAFVCGNENAKQIATQQEFRDYYFDNMNVSELMNTLMELGKGIFGEDIFAEEESEGAQPTATEEGNTKN